MGLLLFLFFLCVSGTATTTTPAFASYVVDQVDHGAIRAALDGLASQVEDDDPTVAGQLLVASSQVESNVQTVATTAPEYMTCATVGQCSVGRTTLTRALIELIKASRSARALLGGLRNVPALLPVNLTALDYGAQRSAFLIPLFLSTERWVSALAIVASILGLVWAVALLVASKFAQLSSNARPYLIVDGLFIVGCLLRLITASFFFTGNGRGWSITINVMSDLVSVIFSTVALWLLYLWADAFFESSRILPRIFLLLIPLSLVAGIACVLAYRLMTMLPSVSGFFPFLAGPVTAGFSLVASIGLLVFSALFFRRLLQEVRDSKEKEFRFRRVREMLVFSAIMTTACFASFVLLMLVAVDRSNLVLRNKAVLWTNYGYLLLEFPFAFSLLVMLTSLLLGNVLSRLCCGGGRTSRRSTILGGSSASKATPLLSSRNSDELPAMYDL